MWTQFFQYDECFALGKISVCRAITLVVFQIYSGYCGGNVVVFEMSLIFYEILKLLWSPYIQWLYSAIWNCIVRDRHQTVSFTFNSPIISHCCFHYSFLIPKTIVIPIHKEGKIEYFNKIPGLVASGTAHLKHPKLFIFWSSYFLASQRKMIFWNIVYRFYIK